jgi:hypothetical protein
MPSVMSTASSSIAMPAKRPPTPAALMTRERGPVNFAPRPLYSANSSQCIAVLFDVSDPEEAEALHLARAVWQGDSDIEALDGDHFVLLIRPGAALREAA